MALRHCELNISEGGGHQEEEAGHQGGLSRMYPNVSLSNREHVGGVLPCCARLLNIQTELALHGNVTTLKIVILPQFNQCLCDCASSSLHIFAVRKDAYRGQ